MFNNSNLERARKRTSSTNNQPDEGHIKIRRTSLEGRESWCFLCEKESPASEIRQAMTMQLNERVNDCARLLNDGRLLAKLSGRDVVAQELKYHPTCLIGLYNRERAYLTSIEDEYKPDKSLRKEGYPLAFSELLPYIAETRRSDGPTDFRLAVLVNLFKQRLEQLGLGAPDVNSTRLKEQILAEMPEMEAFKNGRDVTIAFRKDVGPALSQACRSSEAIILARAANVLRRHMLDR